MTRSRMRISFLVLLSLAALLGASILAPAFGAPEEVSVVSLGKKLSRTLKIAKRADKNAKLALAGLKAPGGQGATGTQGPPGEGGPVGPTGSKGDPCQSDDTACRGLQGTPGTVGATGSTGVQGPRGGDGAPGAPGPAAVRIDVQVANGENSDRAGGTLHARVQLQRRRRAPTLHDVRPGRQWRRATHGHQVS